MATFSNGESGFSVRTKINDVLQHMDGTAGTLVVNEAGADVDFRIESDTEVNAFFVDGANGRVGLGTGTPTTNLDVVAGGARWRLSHDGVGNIQQEALNSAGALYSNLTQFANLFVFSTSGTERMRITTAGNVGIGTSSPASLLHVNGTAGGGAIFSQAGYNYATVSQVLSSADAVFGGGVIASSVLAQVSKTTADAAHYMKAQISEGITFHTNITGAAGTSVARGTNERVRIDTAGNVGIGTSSPGDKLTVNGTIQAYNGTDVFKVFSGSGLTYAGTTSNTPFLLMTNGAEQMRITSAGNVGIGTNAPSGRLHVEGPSVTQNVIASTGNGTFRLADSATGANRKEFTIILDNTNNRVDIQAVQQTVANRNITLNAAGGNVGIGTVSPAALLDVTSGIGSTRLTGHQIFLTRNGNNEIYAQGAASVLALGTNGTERMRIDSVGNVGIGVAPSAWGAGYRALQIGPQSSIFQIGSNTSIINNGFNNGSNWLYQTTSPVASYEMAQNIHRWYNAPSGTAGDPITFTQAMTLDASGNLGLGTASPTARLSVLGAAGTTQVSTFTSQVSSGSYIGFFDTTTTDRPFIGALGDSFVVRTSSTERLRVTLGGSVGIGTSSPAATLHVFGGGGAINSVFDSSTSGDTRIELRTSGTRAGYIYWDASENRFFADSSRFTTFYTGAAERVRITSAGDLLVGTTTVNGAASNAAVVVSGGFRTANGLLSTLASGVATTAFSITAANRGRYEVVAMIINSGDANQYTAMSTILWDGSTGRAISNNGANLTITLSGSNVQVTQSSGATQNISWSVQRIAL